MKMSLFFLVLSVNLLALSYEMRPYGPRYTVVADTVDSTIEKGYCIVQGITQDQSGYIIKNALISTVDKTKKCNSNESGNYILKLSENDSGIFMFHERYGEIVISDYDFKSQHRVTINFTPYSKQNGTQTVKKPVIYLYADQPVNVSITLNHPGMTFMYPAYSDGWNMHVEKNGNLTETTTGKSYPYLFWEANTTNLSYAETENGVDGFLMASDTVVSFFERSLTQLGLTEKEQTDFITFWVPQLIETPFVFVQFLVDEQYDTTIAGIDVDPSPDSQRRIFMLYTPLQIPGDFSSAVSPQVLPLFERSGLTLVEWGGAEVPLQMVAN